MADRSRSAVRLAIVLGCSLLSGRALAQAPGGEHRPQMVRLLSEESQVQTQARQGWFEAHPVLSGTLLGAGGGLALSRFEAVGGVGRDPKVALLGAGVGAWAGLTVSTINKARHHQPISRGAKLGIAAGAIALVVVPTVTCRAAGGCGAGR